MYYPFPRQKLSNSQFYDKDKKARIQLKDAKVTFVCVLLLKIEILRFPPPTIIIYDVGLRLARDLRYQALPFFACNNEKLGTRLLLMHMQESRYLTQQ